jgi:hypothetical protein
MMLLLAFALAVTGFALLAASLVKHHRDLFGHGPVAPLETKLRIAGWLALAASLALSIVEAHLIGLVLWVGLLNAAALTVSLLLTYKEKWWRA